MDDDSYVVVDDVVDGVAGVDVAVVAEDVLILLFSWSGCCCGCCC